MDLLKKYKKLGEQGFKEFVLNLDLRSAKLLKEVLENSMLEDPVYFKWALENRQHFESFLKLSKDQVQQVLKLIPNPEIQLLQALKNHSDEENFVSTKLPTLTSRQYWDNREVHNVTASQQENARIKILETIFFLKKDGLLPPIDWKLPPRDVMDGSNFNLDSIGNYRQFYNNGVVAITGVLTKGKKVGHWVSFYPNGEVYAEGDYNNGIKENEWCFNYPSGKFKSSGPYREDLKNGEWKEFSQYGDFKIVNYQNGKIV